MTILIITSVIHYRHAGRLWAYGPYAREIEIWGDLFDEVVIAAPVREQVPAADATALGRSNIGIVPQREVGGETLAAKLQLAWSLPGMCLVLARAILRADAVHVRCPGNLGLLGVLLSPLLCPRRVAKYAGQWNGHPGEPATVRFQRWLLRSRYWDAPVTVYGQWPGHPPHVISFFTSIMTKEELDQARAIAACPRDVAVPVILYTGRLSSAKNVDVLVRALEVLRSLNFVFRACIVGEGPERARLVALTQELGLGNMVTFTGGLSHAAVLEELGRADALVLVSETEGWPKSLTEAMAHGLVCIGSDRGLIPEMLADGRGFTVPVGDVSALANVLARVVSDRASCREMGLRASEWASRYSLESLREALGNLLLKHWKIPGGRFRALREDDTRESTS